MTPEAFDQRSAEEVSDALRRALARGELDDEPGILGQILEWVFERFGPLEGLGWQGVPDWLSIALATALALALAALVLSVLRRRAARRPPASARGSSVRTRVAELRAAARAARARGDEPLALRYLLFALVAGLGQRGDLRYRDAWTNRELVRRGDPSREARALLAPLIDELEAKDFGREPVTSADVDRLEELCERWLGLEEAA